MAPKIFISLMAAWVLLFGLSVADKPATADSAGKFLQEVNSLTKMIDLLKRLADADGRRVKTMSRSLQRELGQSGLSRYIPDAKRVSVRQLRSLSRRLTSRLVSLSKQRSAVVKTIGKKAPMSKSIAKSVDALEKSKRTIAMAMEKLRRRHHQPQAQAQSPMLHRQIMSPTLYHNTPSTTPTQTPTNGGTTPVGPLDPMSQQMQGVQSVPATDSGTPQSNIASNLITTGPPSSTPPQSPTNHQSPPNGSTPPTTTPPPIPQQQPHQFDQYSMVNDSTPPSIAGYHYAYYLQELFCKYFKVESNGQLKFELDKMSSSVKSQLQYKGRGLEALGNMFAAVATKQKIDQAIDVGTYVLALIKKLKVKYDAASFPDPSGTIYQLRKNFDKKLAELEKNMKELDELKKKGGGQGSSDPWANVAFRFQ